MTTEYQKISRETGFHNFGDFSSPGNREEISIFPLKGFWPKYLPLRVRSQALWGGLKGWVGRSGKNADTPGFWDMFYRFSNLPPPPENKTKPIRYSWY